MPDLGRTERSTYVAEGYWPGTMAGDGRELITQKFLDVATPDEALSIAGAAEPRTVWYIAYPAEDMIDLRPNRELEFIRAGGRR